MNKDTLGLIGLGVGCLLAVVITGIYFSPILKQQQYNHIDDIKQAIINPTHSTTIKSQTPNIANVCMWLSNSSIPPYTLDLIDEINLEKLAQIENASKGGRISRKSENSNYVIVIDNSGNDISKQFFVRLLEKQKQGEKYIFNGLSEYYKYACIKVRYIQFNAIYYMHPIENQPILQE